MKDKACYTLLLVLVLFLCPRVLKAQKLNILSEYVALQINTDTTTMASGMFVFQNNATLQSEYPIFFPINKNKSMGDIVTYDVKGDVELVHLTNDGIAFNFNVVPDDIEHFWLTYTQENLTDTAYYHFSSTGFWKNNLREFQFTLILPEDWTLIESTFTYDETWNDLGKNYYRIQRNDYIPPKDFRVVYERPPRTFFQP